MSDPGAIDRARREGEATEQPDHEAVRSVEELFASYGEKTDEELPLGAYAALTGVYLGGLIAALRAVDRRNCSGLTDISVRDFVLLALATHKLSRLITKDFVTSPFRAPVARYEKATGAGEVSEKPRGTGMQKALGELFT